MSASYVSMLESGARVPTADVLRDLARTLGISMAELVGDTGRTPNQQPYARDDGLLERLLGQAAFAVGDMDYARERAEKAFTQSLSSGSPAQVLECGMHLQRVYARTEELSERVAVLDRVRQTAADAGLDDIHISVLIELASALRDKGDLITARLHANDAAERMPGSPLVGTAEEVRLFGVGISIDCELLNYERAAVSIDPMIAIARKLENNHVLGRAHWVAAVTLARIGRSDEALGHLNDATQMLTSTTSVLDWLKFCHASASILLEIGGRLDEVAAQLDEARAAQRMLRQEVVNQLDVLSARLDLARGEHESAIATCRTVLERDRELLGAERLRLHRTYAEAAAAIGDRRTADMQLRQLAGIAEQEGVLAVAVKAWKELDRLRSQPDTP